MSGLGKFHEGGNGNLLQYFAVINPMDLSMEPGGLESMRSQRVRHSWSQKSCTHSWILYNQRFLLYLLVQVSLLSFNLLH